MSIVSVQNNKKECCGCTACQSACPTNAIVMERDDEGFFYPVVNDKCIECHKCEKICPIINRYWEKGNDSNKQQAFAACTKDESVWRRSASGGAFTEICKMWGDDATVVFGAKWVGLSVEHAGFQGVNNISPLCKSKYIESKIGSAFQEIKRILENGSKVIFSGTPCQVAGLRSFLGKEYDNLLLIDLICHGNGSPIVFENAIRILEKYFHKRIRKFEFRAKNKVHVTDYLSRVYFDNGTSVLDKDIYTQLFLKQYCIRPCCGENCHFRVQNRQGDITLADFKGLNSEIPSVSYSNKNFSSVILNTDKAHTLFRNKHNMNKMEVIPVELDVIKRNNPLFYKQTVQHTKRDEFFSEFLISPDKTLSNWSNGIHVYRPSCRRRVYNILPVTWRRLAISIYKRIV